MEVETLVSPDTGVAKAILPNKTRNISPFKLVINKKRYNCTP